MQTKKITFFVVGILCILQLGACSSTKVSTSNPATTDTRPCITNYSVTGEFWLGRQFKTYEDFQKVSKRIAFDVLVSAITSDGFQITNINKDAGIISASQTVSYGNGKTVPLNAIVKDNSTGGARVELVFTVSGGLAVATDALQSKFCKYLTSVNESKSVSVQSKEAPLPSATTATTTTTTTATPASKPTKQTKQKK